MENKLEKIAALPAERVFPAHYSLGIQPEIVIRMRDAFRELKAEEKLHHGRGTFDYTIYPASILCCPVSFP